MRFFQQTFDCRGGCNTLLGISQMLRDYFTIAAETRGIVVDPRSRTCLDDVFKIIGVGHKSAIWKKYTSDPWRTAVFWKLRKRDEMGYVNPKLERQTAMNVSNRGPHGEL